MSLDRDAARALFANAEPTPPRAGGPAFSAAPPLGTAAESDVYARMASRPARKGPDWRIIAPVGVAALCAGVVLMVASQRHDAEPGQTVAAVDMTPPAPVAPPLETPAPVETAAATPPPATIVEPPATEPATVRVRTRSESARRPAAPRAVASAPSATDAGSNVSSYERAIPPPVLGAPAEVTVTPAPAPPPPVESPAPTPQM